MAGIFLIFSGAIIVVLLGGLLYQRRAIHHAVESVRRTQMEKEAVIRLMDNIGERMTRGIDLDETLKAIAEYVVQSTKAESGAIFLLDDAEKTLQARVIVGLFPPLFEDQEIAASRNKYLAEKIRAHKIKVGEGIVGSAIEMEKPLLIADAEADPRVPRQASLLTPVHSLILTPLRVRGRNLGVLVIANKEGDEVFDSRDTMLLHALAEQAALTVDLVRLSDLLTKQQKLEQELQIAREFQGMLLPQSLPNIEGYEFGALNESALMVGGDFYDFIPVDRNHLGIVIADVSGKGIPGALIMAVVRSHLRAEARDTLSPKEVLRRVNERILSETKENVFVTITYAILDIPNQRIRLVRAGHEPILVRHEKPSARVEAILPEGMAVGLMPTEVFQSTEEVESQLEEGDTVFLYTDGAIEAVNAADEEFGRERLIEFLSGPAGRSAPEWIAGLAGEIRNFSRGIPQHDDITLLAFRVKPEAAAEAEQASTAG